MHRFIVGIIHFVHLSSGWVTDPKLCFVVCSEPRDEWTEAIQMVADKLQRQEEERIQCSPTSNIDNMVEEEMDISTTHHKRKVTDDNRHRDAYKHTLALTQAIIQTEMITLYHHIMGYSPRQRVNLQIGHSVTGLRQLMKGFL